MDTESLDKDILKEYVLENENLKLQIEELLSQKENFIEERDELIKKIERLNYSGLGDW